MVMCLGHCPNSRKLQLLSKRPHCIRSREEGAEAILDPPLHILRYKHGHLQGAGQGMGLLRDGYIQFLGIPQGSGVCVDSLLYIILY